LGKALDLLPEQAFGALSQSYEVNSNNYLKAANPRQPCTQNLEQDLNPALHPAIARFNASISLDIELIEYDITGSVAHAKMLPTPALSPSRRPSPGYRFRNKSARI